MKEEQVELFRFIFRQIRNVRKELEQLYIRKKQLELLSDHFYTSHLDHLWAKSHTQLTELYNNILERYGALKNLEQQLLSAFLDSESSSNNINRLDSIS